MIDTRRFVVQGFPIPWIDVRPCRALMFDPIVHHHHQGQYDQELDSPCGPCQPNIGIIGAPSNPGDFRTEQSEIRRFSFELLWFAVALLQMTRRSMLIRLGVFLVLILSLLAIWQLWLTHERIDPEKAREIALNHVESSPYLERIDTTRVSIVRQGDAQAYMVDFAWKGAGQIRPGLWTEGYYVLVDARSGVVKEAHAYER